MVQRRVRKVHLTGPDELAIRQGATLLEDALHTASLPDVNGSRLLLIRSLEVGPIKTWQSASATALAIERRLRQLSISAVHATSPSAAGQSAVFFRDDAEPYILLARHLARGHRPSAWFWPLAVKGWQPAMAPPEAAKCILFGVLAGEAGVDAAVALFQALDDDREIDFLLAALQPADGGRLLQSFGWARPTPRPWSKEQRPAANQMTTGPPQQVKLDRCLHRWANRWGPDDDRTFWLAGITLLKGQPWRTADIRLPSQAAQLIEAHVPLARPAERANGPELSTAPHAPVQESKRKRAATTDDGHLEKSHLSRPSEPGGSSGTAPLTHPERTIAKHLVADRPEVAIAIADPSPGEIDATASEKKVIWAESVAVGDEEPIDALAGSDTESMDALVASDERMAWPGQQEPSQAAGLFFVIHVLERLDMAGFLREHPQWLAYQLPFRFFRRLAEEVGVRTDDPMLALLSTMPAEIEEFDFVTPVQWRTQWHKSIARDGPCQLRSVGDRPGVRVLFDSSGELPLALWKGQVPAAVSELLDGQKAQFRQPLPELDPVELLLSAWLIAVTRWLQRFTPLALPDLVIRPGYVAATKTHIDVFFDLQQTDIDIRRAGLDLNPGWVPWLGRVIHFHYVPDEADAFPQGPDG